jgi:hypothetical protein
MSRAGVVGEGGMWDLSKRLTLETSDDPMVSEEVFNLTESESHSLVIEQTRDRVR